MKKYLKKYTIGIGVIVLIAQAFIYAPSFLQVFGLDPVNLTLTTTAVNVTNGGFSQVPAYSTTRVGVAPDDDIRVTARYCNNNGNDPEPANGMEVRISIPQSAQNYVAYLVGSVNPAPSDPTNNVTFYNANGGAIPTVNPDARGVNTQVATVAWWFNNTAIPVGTCGDVALTLRSAANIPANVDTTLNLNSRITSDEIFDTTGWRNAAPVQLRVITRPEFNIGDGESNFYTGRSGSTSGSDWYDPVNNMLVTDTVSHRIYVHNYTYETTTNGTRVTISFPQGPRTSWTIPAVISATNANSVTDTLNVNLASGQAASTMSFVDNSLVLYGAPQGDNGTVYSGTAIPSCASSNNATPCYTYTESTGTLVFTLPNQNGCSPFIMQATFRTRFNQVTPDFTIVKEVVNQQNPYAVGANVNYSIRVTNTGQTTFDTVAFRDTYNAQDLQFVGNATIARYAANNNVLSQPAALNVTANNGTLTFADLTTVGGNLAPGEYYLINMNFTALRAATGTCNVAYATPQGLPEENDNACVNIAVNPPTYTIVKDVVGATSYQINNVVNFRVTIRNTGSTTIDQMTFSDVFDTRYLRFEGATGSRGSAAPVAMNATANNGTITVNDITAVLGDLAANETYTLTLTFRTTDNINQTCDVATATVGQTSMNDNACIAITLPTALPNTSK